MSDDCAPAAALRAAFGRPALPSGAGELGFNDRLRFIISTHSNWFWSHYLRDALNRIEELERAQAP